VSWAHDAGLTLLVAGQGRLGCDVQEVGARASDDRLGAYLAVRDRVVAEAGESAAVAGARVLAALGALRKAGVAVAELDVECRSDGWVVFGGADAVVATWVATVSGRVAPVVFAVLR
jgi:enediyne polyketide synthase